MGLLDKAKQQADQLVQKGQEVAQKGQGKLQEAQAKRRQEALLRDLGAAVYAERSGRSTPETAAEIERLVAELRSQESEQGPVDTSATRDQQEEPGAATGEGSTTIGPM